MAKILITRLSALGDVAMLVPVVASVAWKYPQDRFFVMTRAAFTPLFENLAFNVTTIPVDVKGKHKGFIGLLKLAFACLKSELTHVADEHDVLRSKIIRWLMMLSGRKVCHIDKGRAEKKNMIESKVLQPPLTHTTERYLKVFADLGFPSKITFNNILDFVPKNYSALESIVGRKTGLWIGIAPFARHEGKKYPVDKMGNIIERLSKDPNIKVFLFGAGPTEKAILKQWSNKYERVVDLPGKLTLDKELLLMSQLDLLVSMDSANMHLASLVQTPVISIWGATHPSLGFYGFGQDIDNVVEIELPCRPCSVFGDVPCMRNDYACLNGISEDTIVNHIYKVLNKKA